MRLVGFALLLAVGLQAEEEIALPVEGVENAEVLFSDPGIEEGTPIAAVVEEAAPVVKKKRGCKNCKPRKKKVKIAAEETIEVAN